MLLGVSAQVSASALQEMRRRPLRSIYAALQTHVAPVARTTRAQTPQNVLRSNADLFPRDVENRSAI